jgi:outer membrane protein OmpA-like peptidoglycan-associated protein
MIKSRQNSIWVIAGAIALVLATSGCASKKYVRQQVTPVNTRVSQLEAKTNDQIAYLSNKQQRDVSQLNERLDTTDQRVGQLSDAVTKAQGTASRAMENANDAKAKASNNETAIAALGSGVANALHYELVENGDVTFAFNKATLTPEAKAALDQIAQKFQSLPRGVIELTGFTDRRGSTTYNLELSRRRAEAVQRYLVMKKIPVRCIHIVGMGKEAPPAVLEGEVTSVTESRPTRAEAQRLARRVHINVYGAGDIMASSR